MNSMHAQKTIALLFSFAFLVFSALTCDLAQAESQCHLKGLKASEGALGYKKRQSKKLASYRCEGFYQSPVNSKFEILSLLRGGVSYNDQSILEVVWPSRHHDSSIFITGTSKTPGVFYRMDAVLGGKQAFHWPVSEVIVKSGILPEDLGIFGWYEENNNIVYTPLNVSESTHNEKTTKALKVTLVIRADFDLERIIVRKKDDPSMSGWVVMQERFGAGEPINIDMEPWFAIARDSVFPLQVVGKIIDDDEQIMETFHVQF